MNDISDKPVFTPEEVATKIRDTFEIVVERAANNAHDRNLPNGERVAKRVSRETKETWEKRLSDPTTQLADFGINSLQFAERIVNIEDKLKIRLPIEELDPGITLPQLVQVVQQKLFENSRLVKLVPQIITAEEFAGLQAQNARPGSTQTPHSR